RLVTEHDQLVASPGVVASREGTAERRRCAENLEVLGSDPRSLELRRLPRSRRDRDHVFAIAGDRLEAAVVLPQVHVVAGRVIALALVLRGRRHLDDSTLV